MVNIFIGVFSLDRNCQYEPKRKLTVFGEFYEGTIYLDIEKVKP